jgi:hypothetical protein
MAAQKLDFAVKEYGKPLKHNERQILVNGLRTSQQERQHLREQNLKMRAYLEYLVNTQFTRLFPNEIKRIHAALDIVE